MWIVGLRGFRGPTKNTGYYSSELPTWTRWQDCCYRRTSFSYRAQRYLPYWLTFTMLAGPMCTAGRKYSSIVSPIYKPCVWQYNFTCKICPLGQEWHNYFKDNQLLCDWISDWLYWREEKSSQRPVTGESMDTNGEHILISPLHKHVVKLTSKYLHLYP